MYSLACINLSSEAHRRCPRFVTVSGSQGAEGLVPSLAPRCGARKNYTSIPHPVSRKIFKKFSDPFSGARAALRARPPRVRPATRASAAGVSHYTSPRRFVKGAIRKTFRPALNAARRRIWAASPQWSISPFSQRTSLPANRNAPRVPL